MPSSLGEAGRLGCRAVRVQDVIVAGPVEHMDTWLNGLRNFGVLLHGLGDEVMVVHHGAVIAYSGHGSRHAPVQIDHPHRHLDTHHPQ